ncbi:MAG: glycine cleavage system aminomethyltransferase GcvT [Propionibacteriaceae bacterium]|nr:glycine cleavage system aminomethyltransferase GcvT [Propionibacteriaceae bacterium]
MTIETRLSPLQRVHEAAGARFTDFAGWNMPLRYGSELEEHRAVRERAGLFDLSHMGQIIVDGPQAGEFLDFAVTGRLSTKAVGRATYTMITEETGGIVDDLVVYRLDETLFMVVANASNRVVVGQLLRERSDDFDVEVSEPRLDRALVAVQGPAAASILAGLGVEDLASLKYYWSRPATVAGVDVLLARTGYTGEDGFELFCDADDAVALWEAVAAAGESAGLIPCGLACRDTLRLEAGMPLYGHELTRDLTPFDAQLGRVVDLKKENFVGREMLAKAAETQPSRLLVGLSGQGRRAARDGYTIMADGAEIGVVTSGALSPTLGHPIALAYVETARAVTNATVEVDIRGAATAMTIVDLPFYHRPRP